MTPPRWTPPPQWMFDLALDRELDEVLGAAPFPDLADLETPRRD